MIKIADEIRDDFERICSDTDNHYNGMIFKAVENQEEQEIIGTAEWWLDYLSL